MTVRVLHLAGSAVSEFLADVSRLYAADALTTTADPDRYEFHVAYVSPDATWRFPADLGPVALDGAAAMSLPEALAHIVALGIDVVVPQMFCVPGMTVYRALFEALGIPYVGNRPEVMALGADKAHARAVVGAAGVDVPPGRLVRAGDAVDLADLVLPVVVKPVDADNSAGVTLVRRPAELEGAITEALTHSSAALVERYVELGREVRCGLLERDGELIGLPLEEYNVDPATKPVRLADDKLRRGDAGNLTLVAKDAEHAWIVDPSDPVTARVREAARRCHVALGCRDYSLFDFRIDPDGRPWFLEASLYNSFARKSVLSVMAAAAGLDASEVFAEGVGHALARGA